METEHLPIICSKYVFITENLRNKSLTEELSIVTVIMILLEIEIDSFFCLFIYWEGLLLVQSEKSARKVYGWRALRYNLLLLRHVLRSWRAHNTSPLSFSIVIRTLNVHSQFLCNSPGSTSSQTGPLILWAFYFLLSMNSETSSLFASHSPTLTRNTEWLITSRSFRWVNINTLEISIHRASKHSWQLSGTTPLSLCRSKLERQFDYSQKHQLTLDM